MTLHTTDDQTSV